MKEIFTIISLLFLNSCLAFSDHLFAEIPDGNKFIDRFPQNKKGIILLKITSNHLTTTWCEADLEFEIKNKKCLKINPTDYYQIIMLEPGLYEIEGYKISNRRFQATRQKEIEPVISNITGKRKTPPLVTFEVTEGKISYLGNIKFSQIALSSAQVKDEDFLEIKNAFLNKDQKFLKKNFKGHQFEEEIIVKKINDDENILIKNLARTKSDIVEIKQIEKKEQREKKKSDLKFLKMKAKKFRSQNSQKQKKTYEN